MKWCHYDESIVEISFNSQFAKFKTHGERAILTLSHNEMSKLTILSLPEVAKLQNLLRMVVNMFLIL